MRGEVSGTYSIDSLGFRNVGQDYGKARYFFIGDSFVFGSWVPREKTFYGRVQSTLGESVISFGTGGYGLSQYETILRKHFGSRRTDTHIFLCFFANDLEPLSDRALLHDYYARSGWRSFTRDASLVDRLAFRRTTTYHLIRYSARIFFGAGDSAPTSDATVLYKRRGASEQYFVDSLYVPVETKIVKMLEFCQASHFQVTVLLFPSKESVYYEEYSQLFRDSAYLEIERLGYERIERLVSELGVPVRNLTDRFRSRKKEGLFFKHDPHINERGHELVAGSIMEMLKPKPATTPSN